VSWITQFETVLIVVAGVYLIADGKLTQGALIGSPPMTLVFTVV